MMARPHRDRKSVDGTGDSSGGTEAMDRTTIQRVRSHGASIDRHAFEIADRFLDGLMAHCPHLCSPLDRFRGTPEQQRRCIAQRWAWLVRHLGELGHITPELEALHRYLCSRGLSAGDFRMARASLLEAMREVEPAGWTAAVEADWATAFDECLRLMSPAEAIPMPGVQRYAAAA